MQQSFYQVAYSKIHSISCMASQHCHFTHEKYK
jgi:hypothetical protein